MTLPRFAFVLALTVLPLGSSPPVGPPIMAIRSITLDYLPFQKNAPVRIVGGRSSSENFVEEAYVINVTDRPVVACRVGWVVQRVQTQNGRRVIEDRASLSAAFQGGRFETVLLPMEERTLGKPVLSMDEVEAALDSQGIEVGAVSLGIVYVRFEDGGEWSYPLGAKRRFETERDPALHQGMRWPLERLDTEISKTVNKRRTTGYLAETEAPNGGLRERVSAWLRETFGSNADERLCRQWAAVEGGGLKVTGGRLYSYAWLCPSQICPNQRPNIVTYECP